MRRAGRRLRALSQARNPVAPPDRQVSRVKRGRPVQRGCRHRVAAPARRPDFPARGAVACRVPVCRAKARARPVAKRDRPVRPAVHHLHLLLPPAQPPPVAAKKAFLPAQAPRAARVPRQAASAPHRAAERRARRAARKETVPAILPDSKAGSRAINRVASRVARVGPVPLAESPLRQAMALPRPPEAQRARVARRQDLSPGSPVGKVAQAATPQRAGFPPQEVPAALAAMAARRAPQARRVRAGTLAAQVAPRRVPAAQAAAR